jgi:hypothetical protein
VRTAKEIQEMLDNGLPEGAVRATRWPAMTYEEGVDATVMWVLGHTDENPLAD